MPIQLPHMQEPLLKHELRECKLIRDGNDRFVNITVRKRARLKRRYATVLPIDMDIRKLATTIEDGKPRFYRKDVRQTKLLQAAKIRRQRTNHEVMRQGT